MQNFAPDRSLTILFLQRQFVTLSKFGCSLQCFGIPFALESANSLKYRRIMDTMNFTKVNLNFHHPITLIDRDDGKKNKTLEKEAGLPRV